METLETGLFNRNYSLTLRDPNGDRVQPTDSLVRLVEGFGLALLDKLLKARAKYGYEGDEWMGSDWQQECLNGLLHHIDKGDPLDNGAFSAFMWYHKWSSTPTPTILERTQAFNGLAEATSRATKAESRAEGLQSYIGEAMREVPMRDTSYITEATRLLKQCRRPELAAAVYSEMSAHGSTLNRWALAKARISEAQVELAEQETAALEWAKEIEELKETVRREQTTAWSREKIFKHEISELEDRNWRLAVRIRELTEPAPTPPPSSPAAAGPGEASEFFLNGDPAINPFGPR